MPCFPHKLLRLPAERGSLLYEISSGNKTRGNHSFFFFKTFIVEKQREGESREGDSHGHVEGGVKV
jgi:hypothetical protein